MSGAFESTLLSPPRSTNKLFMETGFGVNAGFERYRNSEYAVSDGATSNRAAGIYGPFDAVNNPREWVAGAASLTIAAVVTVPTSNPPASAYINWYGSSATIASTAGHLYVTLTTAGTLQIRQGGASFPTDVREINHTTFRTTYSGQTIFLKITLTQGTTNPVVGVNGVDISASFSLSTGGTPPAWLDAAMVPTYRLVGYNWPSGPSPVVTPILGTTSSADDTFYLSTGKWPAWVVAGGTTTKFNTAAFTVGSGTGSFSANTSTSLVCTGATTALNAYSNASQVLIAGQRIRANLTVSGVTGSGVLFTTDSLGSGLGGSFGSNISVLANGTADYDITVTSSGAFFVRFVFTSTTAASITINSLERIGALSIPSIQPINVVDDVSGIGNNCGLILGAVTTATSNKKVWRIADLTKTSGNEQLLGGAVFVGTSQDYIKSWTIVNEGGTTTVSLGNVSGGAQYVSGLSVPTGTTVVTLLTNTPLTTNLWCNASTTASLTHVIEGYRTT